MKKLLCFAMLAVLAVPSMAGTPLTNGHALTTGQVIVGVTGAAPVANTVTGTANQITVTTGAEGGNLAFSFPTSVTMTNLTVTGTLSPYSTGTFTGENITLDYGINAATGVFTNTGASSLDIGGGLNAGTGNVAIIDATGKVAGISSTYFASLDGSNLLKISSIAVDGVYTNAIADLAVTNGKLAGSIAPAKVTGTAAILGANSFTAAQSVIGGVTISSSATSSVSCNFGGAIVTLSTAGVSECTSFYQTSDHIFYTSTQTISHNIDTCAGTACYKAWW